MAFHMEILILGIIIIWFLLLLAEELRVPMLAVLI